VEKPWRLLTLQHDYVRQEINKEMDEKCTLKGIGTSTMEQIHALLAQINALTGGAAAGVVAELQIRAFRGRGTGPVTSARGGCGARGFVGRSTSSALLG
jgi:hypothetical protein